MCGINILLTRTNTIQTEEVIRKMNNSLRHRGPDDEGVYSEKGDWNVALGHRRLSIIDLSSGGHQPMFSDDQRFVIVFNGEIYNYQKLKFDLSRAVSGSGISPYTFSTNSDTEVVLAAFKAWGADCLNKLEGMFAFAIWDKKDQTLFLARDRVGKKPLYFYPSENTFIVSSEIKALLASDLVPRKLNRNSLKEYFQYQTVYGKETIVKNIFSLGAGHYATWSNGLLSWYPYWEPQAAMERKILEKEVVLKDATKIHRTIHDLLFQSVEKRLISDVPFGAFLSGGIDSSAVVGIMSKLSSQKVRSFSVVFKEQEFSEQKYAEQIASKFNTDHTSILLGADEFLKLLPEALAAMDHPGGDGPNTYVVAGVTKKAGITMALSGIGGDELFAGYQHFIRLKKMQSMEWMNVFPPGMLGFFMHAIKGFKNTVQTEKMRAVFSAPSFQLADQYPISRQTFSNRQIESMLKLNAGTYMGGFMKEFKNVDKDFLLAAVSRAEMGTYLQSVLLRDTDNMSMAHSMEVRAPFLDHELVEFVLAVDDKFKYPHSPKQLLVDSLGDLLPAEVTQRKKMGFTLPWEEWMKKELREFCESRLKALSKRSFIGRVTPENLWYNFLAGKPTVTWSRLWHLVVLEDWLQRHKIDE